MTLEEKNKSIENYIRSISSKVNTQYGKILIDEKMINIALSIFLNSKEDLETEIIPKINEMIKQIINKHLDYQRKLEEIAKIDSTLNYGQFLKFNQFNK